MYLKSLEIQGFKSFADKTVLQFGSDITAIVGPNGSGKSNISDAIRWVMGEQSTRALRGAKMEDVIFGGTQKRAQVGFAEASLVLDNTDGAFAVDASEVMVTRRFYRSGESEYYINRQSARLRDIHELFMDTGLGKEGYSNISQGRIDEILALKSTDRRDIFEEAAGISKFRHRKEETERKLQSTEDNLLRIGDKISELELQRTPLQEQAQKAQKYLAFRQELRGIEIAVWLDQLARLGERKKKAESDYASSAFILEQAHAALESLYSGMETATQRLRDYDTKLEQRREEIHALERRQQQLEGEKQVLLSTAAQRSQNLQQLQQELSEQTQRGSGLLEQIAQAEQRITEIGEEMAQLQETQQALQQQADACMQSRDGTSQSYLVKQAQRSTLGEQLAQYSAELEGLQQSAQSAAQRSQAAENERQNANKTYTEICEKRRQCENDEALAKQKAAASKNRLDGYQLRLQQRQARLTQLQQELNRSSIALEAQNARIRLLRDLERDFEGYSKAVKVVMQQKECGLLKNIHGPVSKLITTKDQYAIAVETAMGAAMQYIVVSAQEDAKAAIASLKRMDAGRATFLPMQSIEGKTLQERGLAQKPGYLGIAAELVECQAPYRAIVSNLLGRTVIVQDLDAAIPIARSYANRFRIVTLDGQVINAGGAMTGGSLARNTGILSRANELKRLQEEQSVRSEALQAQRSSVQELERELEAARYESDVAAAQLRQEEDEVLRLSGELQHEQILMQTVASRVTAAEEEAAREKARCSALEAEAEEKKTQIAALQQQKQLLERKLSDLEEGQRAQSEQLQAVLDALSGVRAQQAAKQAQQESIAQNRAQLSALEAQMAQDAAQKKTLLESYAAENDLAQQQLAELEQRALELAGQTQSQRQLLQECLAKRMADEAEKTSLERQTQDKNKEILNMERESARLEQKKLSAELEEKQILDKLWDTYELTPSSAQSEAAALASFSEGQRKISELRRKIGALGTPNLGAIEEYARINERYTYLTAQREDVMTSKRELEEIIRAITKEMTSIFTAEFAKIDTYFQKTFVEMFGGGKGELILEDPEHPLSCGIEIRVQPPGKQLKTLTLLSGGEKAFVAIALYFAIMKVRPTPFCMLDEIDAALDERNVARFAAYLRSLSKKTQFIVVTHRRGTMEAADVLYGVTMQEQGVSKMLHLDLDQMSKQLGITQ